MIVNDEVGLVIYEIGRNLMYHEEPLLRYSKQTKKWSKKPTKVRLMCRFTMALIASC